MAEILIKAIDAFHPDPLGNKRGCYKAGDPVVVFEDGHEWGAEERPPKFFLIKIPGVPAAQLKPFLAPDPFARRKFRLASAQFSALRTLGGSITVSPTFIGSLFEEKLIV